MNAVLKAIPIIRNYGYPKTIREALDVRAKGRRENIRQKINSLKDRATELEIRINRSIVRPSTCDSLHTGKFRQPNIDGTQIQYLIHRRPQ